MERLPLRINASTISAVFSAGSMHLLFSQAGRPQRSQIRRTSRQTYCGFLKKPVTVSGTAGMTFVLKA